MIKKLIFNKTKNASVRFFIYMSSMCVQLFTAFEEAVLRIYLGECPKIEYVISMETNHGENKFLVFSPYFFILIIINIQ